MTGLDMSLPRIGANVIERREPNADLPLRRRLSPLLGCQFFADLGDNFFLNTLSFLILFKLGGPSDVALIPLATAALVTPSFFLSALGGELADRFDMALVAQRLRLAGMGVSVLAAVGLLLWSLPILVVALAAFGVVAALFAPLKYGMLPRLLSSAELPVGNAFVQGSILATVLLGTMTAGLLVRYDDMRLLAALMLAFPVVSWSASLAIVPTGEAAPGLVVRRNVLASTWGTLKGLRDDRRIGWGALAICWFWAAGVIVLAILPPLVKNVLGGAEDALTFCPATFAVGIAAGSGLAAWLAAGRIVLTTAVVGAVLIGLFALAIGGVTSGMTPAVEGQSVGQAFGSVSGLVLALALAGLAISGGLLIVPIMAAVQTWAGADRRARIIAAVNGLTAASMALAALFTAALQASGVTPPVLFVLLGVAALVAAAIIAKTMPSRRTV
jgi:acyl-[acyl-carrier-protein]-phospholipid O-acyltransferase/long-chain-fatty-acid--[acyl-carrier-protein] ligase